jgi:integrase
MSKDHWGDGGVYLRGRIWWFWYPCDGATIRESSKSSSKAVANRKRRERLSAVQNKGIAGPAMERVKVTELLDDLLADYKSKRKTSWWAELNVNKHLRPFFKYHRAARVGTRHIQEYIAEKRKSDLADSTINRHLALLHRAFRMGSRCDPPKVARVPTIELFNERKSVRKGFPEQDQFEKLRSELPEEIRPIATFAFHTGCRRGEILGLKWVQVDLTRGFVRLNPGETKSKEPRMIPLTKELRTVLENLKSEHDANWPWSPWVFTRQGMQVKAFYGAWRAAATRAGVTGMLLHDMRRAGVRNLVRAGVPEVVAMRISGHRTRAVFDRYNIVSEGDLSNAAALLDKHLNPDKEKK